MIQEQVESIRNLSPAQDIKNEIMPKIKLKLIMLDLFIDDEFLASLEG